MSIHDQNGLTMKCSVSLFKLLSLPRALSLVSSKSNSLNDYDSTTVVVKTATATIIPRVENGTESFANIPFAEPPLKDLRLRPPQRLSHYLGTINATDVTTAYPQQALRPQDLPGLAELVDLLPPAVSLPQQPRQSEHCLNVTITTVESRLPMLF